MKYVEAGGARISAIGLGAWQFGSAEWGYGEDYARDEALKIVRRALELGVNLVDTAELYGFGRSERIVGEAIKGHRDQVFLATKLFPVGLPLQVASRARGSARRLGVDRIDLYQQHWPSPMFPPGATMPRMRKLVESGLVTHVGVSNHSLAQWQAAEKSFGGPVLSNQVKFNLLERGPMLDLVPWARENGRVVIAYSPLAQGLLSGKYLETTPRNLRRLRPAFSTSSRARLRPLIAALGEIATRHGATPAQVSLAWLIRKPSVVAIPGASSVQQMEQNASAADIELSDEEDARLSTLATGLNR
ncbi:MAG TPA: aldo/keto reductase [Candidatus Dormibacteraeota bacterium]